MEKIPQKRTYIQFWAHSEWTKSFVNYIANTSTLTTQSGVLGSSLSYYNRNDPQHCKISYHCKICYHQTIVLNNYCSISEIRTLCNISSNIKNNPSSCRKVEFFHPRPDALYQFAERLLASSVFNKQLEIHSSNNNILPTPKKDFEQTQMFK